MKYRLADRCLQKCGQYVGYSRFVHDLVLILDQIKKSVNVKLQMVLHYITKIYIMYTCVMQICFTLLLPTFIESLHTSSNYVQYTNVCSGLFQGHFLSTLDFPCSSYSCLEIHICWNDPCKKMQSHQCH